MSRKYLYAILACLLSLLPVSSFAQSLTKCEYWFDDNFDKRKPIKLSGTEDEIDMMINTESLTPGVHEIFFRFLQSDGQYSSISSRRFTKFGLGDSKLLEYWFDGNRNENQPLTGVIPSEDPNAIDFDDLIDCGSLTSGFHTLSYRVVSEDGLTASSIITKSFYKYVGLGDTKLLEYWFDGNREEVHRLPGVTSSEEEDALDFDNMIDCSKLPTGFHTISLRVISQNKLISSSVITKSFFKYVGLGNANILEYWFDDNRKDISRIPGTVSEDGTTIDFLKEVSLNSLTPGHHRIYYRVVSKDGLTNSAINTATIMVRSKYDNIDLSDLKLSEYAYWTDDEEPEIITRSNPTEGFRLEDMLDARRLSEGDHTLHLQFGNSAGIWNGPVDFAFTKTKVDDPVITANATVKDGIVSLDFNSVPYGLRYLVVRQYSNGKLRKVDEINSTEYPAILKSTDTPATGTYTYYVEGIYTGADGTTQKVRSGDVSVTVDKVAASLGRGSIYGSLYINGIGVNPGFFYHIYINGEKASSQNEYKYGYGGYGDFWISDIPYGTQLTVGVRDRNDIYSFNKIELIVDENTKNKSFRFNGTKLEDGEEEDNLLPDDAPYDLTICNKVGITPNAWELKVWNKSNKAWEGNIIVKIISKKVKDLYDKLNAEGSISTVYYLFHPDAGNDLGPYYKTSADMHVKIPGNKEEKSSTVLTLDFIDLPEVNQNEDFYVCVFSKKKGSEVIKELDCAGDKTCSNPQIINFNPSDFTVAQGNDYKQYIEEYQEILRHLKMMAKWGDPFALEINTFGKDFDDIINNLGNKKGDPDGFEKDLIVGYSQSAGMLLNLFFKDLHKAVKNAAKTLKDSEAVKFSNDIVEVYNTLNSFYSSTTVDKNLIFFETSKQVLNLCKSLNLKDYLALGIYKNYFEVGEAMAKAVNNLSNKVSEEYVWERMVSGSAVFKIKIRKYPNKNWTEYFPGWDYYQQKNYKTHPGQIRSISIVLKTPAQSSIQLESSSYDVECDNEGITIKNVEFPGKYNTNYSSTEAWMTITWKNNRVTHIPLLDKGFVKLKNFSPTSKDPLTVTVELQSETYYNRESIPNKLSFVKP